MRAIIRCHSEQKKDLFEATLRHVGWWPEVPQDSASAIEHREEILRLVALEDTSMVRETAWYMIFRHDQGKTWGLVNSPQHGTIEIRIKNKSSASLRAATEHLIQAIQDSGTGPSYSFRDVIEVFEPMSQHHAFYGKPLPTRKGEKWKLAKGERLWEWKAARWLFFSALVFIVVSTPPVMQFLENLHRGKGGGGTPAGPWNLWIEGFIGRLATSALVSGFVSLLTVVLHYQDLKRFGAVRWQLGELK